jgi:hypothetical protein
MITLENCYSLDNGRDGFHIRGEARLGNCFASGSGRDNYNLGDDPASALSRAIPELRRIPLNELRSIIQSAPKEKNQLLHYLNVCFEKFLGAVAGHAAEAAWSAMISNS